MLHEGVAGQPADLSGPPANGQSLGAEIAGCQEAIQQTLMALPDLDGAAGRVDTAGGGTPRRSR
jgi:hypothetical protein